MFLKLLLGTNLFNFTLIKLCIALVGFSCINAFAMNEYELLRRYPWMDKYKYIENHSSLKEEEEILQFKVESLKSKIEQSLNNKQYQLNKQEQNDLKIEMTNQSNQINLTQEQENQLTQDISFIESNIDNLGPNLKALLLKRLNDFKYLTNPNNQVN